MKYGTRDVTGMTGTALEAAIARALATELFADGYRVGCVWAVDPDNPNHLTDGVRSLNVYLDTRAGRARISLVGSLHNSLFEPLPPSKRHTLRPGLIRASVAFDRGPGALASETRRRVLDKLNGLIPAVKDRIARELADEVGKDVTRALLGPTFSREGYLTRNAEGAFGTATVNHNGSQVTLHLTVPSAVAVKLAKLLDDNLCPASELSTSA